MLSRQAISRAQATIRPSACVALNRHYNFDANRDIYTKLEQKLPKFDIVDSTLREGEQFASCEFTKQERIFIAKSLDKLGVDYIEVVNPAASLQAVRDCEAIANLNLNAKVLTHTRCHMHDIKIAAETGVDGINCYMATSKILSQHSHGKGIDAVIEAAQEVIEYVQGKGLEIRFSCEDSFRSDRRDILRIYEAVAKMGVNRVGVADTVGIATPYMVYDTVSAVRSVIGPDVGIEFHTHNDTGCAIANSLVALDAGATHIDTSVLGIGERNGIPPLGGFLARMYAIDKQAILERYDLNLVQWLDKYVAAAVGVPIPFNEQITGSAAFTHKAGVHSKAVMTNPEAYEVLNPADFGVERRIQLAHRLTGWNAMANRARALELDLSDDMIKAATTRIKNLADQQAISVDMVDAILMKLAASPRASSSTFVTWNTESHAKSDALQKAAQNAAEALAKYEAEIAAQAILDVSNTGKVDERPQMVLHIEGHLFDKNLLNRLMDIAVDSPCDFEVQDIQCASRNENISHCKLRFWGNSTGADDLVLLKKQIGTMVEANALISDCRMTQLSATGDMPAASGDL